MEINNAQLKELQTLEAEVLKNFLSVCETLNLKYYLLGGTMLGAVRHQGFIPWDDDIDVGMPRRDYEIFVTEGCKYISSNYFIQTHNSDSEYPMNFAKIRINNTTYIESAVANKNMHHGVYIDVFPLDIYPRNDTLFILKKKILDFRISATFSNIKTSKKAKVFQILSRCFYPTVKSAIKSKEKHLKSVKNGEKIANFCGAWGEKEIVPAEWYGEGTTLTFEGMKVIVPSRYDLWLTQVYGDYMQLPPEHKRKSHHPIVAFDLEISYKNYIR